VFEGPARPVIFGQVWTFEAWQPYYCDEPYVAGGCPAEFKPSEVPDRVHSGNTSQQWFCFDRTCRAGVYQTFPTSPGEECEVGAYVQTWSAGYYIGTDGDLYTSYTETEDDRDNSVWRIVIDPEGGTYAFDDDLLRSRDFTYEDGHYDEFAFISFAFTATSNHATVFFENRRLWPFQHNDSYIDDAYVVCN